MKIMRFPLKRWRVTLPTVDRSGYFARLAVSVQIGRWLYIAVTTGPTEAQGSRGFQR